MITEDYVSFENAKLLKKKGFDEECISVYHDGELQLVSSLGIFCGEGYDEQILTYTNSECEWSPIMISAPTLQRAMKWLRKEHKIGVFPSTYGLAVGVNGSVKHVYGTAIINLETYELMTNDIMPMPTYEEATEAAIKYCLENLI